MCGIKLDYSFCIWPDIPKETAQQGVMGAAGLETPVGVHPCVLLKLARASLGVFLFVLFLQKLWSSLELP